MYLLESKFILSGYVTMSKVLLKINSYLVSFYFECQNSYQAEALKLQFNFLVTDFKYSKIKICFSQSSSSECLIFRMSLSTLLQLLAETKLILNRNASPAE